MIFSSTVEYVFVLTVYKNGDTSFPLGLNSAATWSITADGQATLIYSTDQRLLSVNLVCSAQIDQLIINGEVELKKYNMTLLSKCACWNGC